VDRDGEQDSGSETGMPDVVVTLYGPQTNVLGVTTTDVNGVYGFTNLVPGTYFVGFETPPTYERTLQDTGW
jgi:serine-aspartate repeat-containing protein C/D/E